MLIFFFLNPQFFLADLDPDSQNIRDTDSALGIMQQIFLFLRMNNFVFVFFFYLFMQLSCVIKRSKFFFAGFFICFFRVKISF